MKESLGDSGELLLANLSDLVSEKWLSCSFLTINFDLIIFQSSQYYAVAIRFLPKTIWNDLSRSFDLNNPDSSKFKNERSAFDGAVS